jgi:hypothetical protein
MRRKYGLMSVLMTLALFSLGYADSAVNLQLPEGLVIKPYAYGHFEFGQIPRGSLNALTNKNVAADSMILNKGWLEDQLATVGLDATFKDHLEIKVGLLTQLFFSYPFVNENNSRMTKNSSQAVGIDDAYAQIHFGNAATPYFAGQVGFFKYKYNPDARNFGDYLFRTYTYPIVFNMGFDFPQARMLGLRVETNGGAFTKELEGLKLEGLLTSSTLPPTMVWSVAGIASYDVLNRHFINFGLGIDFSDLLNVYNDQTYPRYTGSDNAGDPLKPRVDGIHYIKSIQYNEEEDVSDTVFGYYTFAGTKVMARVSIDPKVLLPWHIFGENDLKIYAEADIIGLTNYPDSGYTAADSKKKDLIAPSYNSIVDKTPIAIGFNIPAFKMLDVLNIEVEYFGAKYYNDASGLAGVGSNPLPYDWFGKTSDSPVYQKSKWKWSLFAKKSFYDGHFSIIGQIARDHLMLASTSYDYTDQAETMVTAKDWWWALKTSWMF